MAHRHYGALPPKPKKEGVKCWHVSDEDGSVCRFTVYAPEAIDKPGSGYYSSEVAARHRAIVIVTRRLAQAQTAYDEAVRLMAEAEDRAALAPTPPTAPARSEGRAAPQGERPGATEGRE